MKYPLLFASCLCVFASCAVQEKQSIDYVDPFIGTGFHGHTYPGATVPFGAVQLSPDTRRGNWDACSGYHYSDSTLLGFSHTHLSGTGCIDLGDVLIRPTTQPVNLKSEGDIYEPASFKHSSEKAVPGYYKVELEEEGIKVELTSTLYAGMHRYTYRNAKDAAVLVDLHHMLSDDETIYESSLTQTAPNELSGMRRTGAWVDNQYVYFVIQFSKPIQQMEWISDKKQVSDVKGISGGNIQGVAHFGTDKEVVAKVGLSIVSEDNARANLLNDIPEFNFDAVAQQASDAWKKALNGIHVEGGTDEQRTNFYTAWYHALVVPNTVSDANGEYRRHDGKIAAMPRGHQAYSTFSLWDTFRAWHPLMTLIDAPRVNDMVNSLLAMYDATGELPIWPLSSGETRCMIGYHSASVIVDAYQKGIRDFNAEKALNALIESSEINKKGASYYIENGFIPANMKRESVSCLLEFAYDDWAIAQLAKALGKEDIYNTYMKRCQSYHNVFDGAIKFFRGKRMDGNWNDSFTPEAIGSEFTEATAWQYRFFVPHDVNGLIQLFGSKENFIQGLDELFTTESKVLGDQPDVTGLVGQYAHGNEPSHHMAYLYNYVGQPWKTQEMTRRLLDEMYQPTPEGIVGNEDCGQMSAWYIMSAMGLYAVCPGSNEFALTTPLFDKLTLPLSNGKVLTITANNPGKNVYIDAVSLNGKTIDKNFVTYDQLMEGGSLVFTLSNKPNMERGTSEEASLYSVTNGKMVSDPFIDKDLFQFVDEIKVSLGSATEGAQLYYTLDGTEPTEESSLYKEPITLNQSVTLKVKGFKEGYASSHTFSVDATKAKFHHASKPAGSVAGTNYTYCIGTFERIADMLKAKVLDSGVMPEPSIKNATQPDHFGYVFTGLIQVPEDGVYTFATRSDDGSILYIDGVKVVDNDFSHSAVRATGKIALYKGCHNYRLEYFEDYEGDHLSWEWQLPSKKELEAIPANVLFTK